MKKRKSGYTPKMMSFCVGCGADRKAMNLPPGFCRKCEPTAKAQLATSSIITYCRKCETYGTAHPQIHGRELVASAMRRIKDRAVVSVVIVYEADTGCPTCYNKDDGLSPHPMMISLVMLSWDAA